MRNFENGNKRVFYITVISSARHSTAAFYEMCITLDNQFLDFILSIYPDKPYVNCAIVVTPSHVVVFEDFIRWIFFTDSKAPLLVKASVRVQDLKNIVSPIDTDK